MKSRVLLAALALCGAVAAPNLAAAQASVAYAVRDGLTNIRSGPGQNYTVIAYARPGSLVTVYGCLADISWCDSSVQGIRGWISTTRLEFAYAGNLVPVPSYYSYFRAPTVTFDFGYNDSYFDPYDPYYNDGPDYGHHRHRRGHNSGHDHGHGDNNGDHVDLPGNPGIFPEEGGPPNDRGSGRHHRRPREDQAGNQGSHHSRNNSNDGPPAISDGPTQGSAGAPCPPRRPTCH